ncbi:MAG: hypothetical protein FWE09_00205 [Treponema sp.]|nr:hypothetical protein [Treponema sp.]
MISSTFDVSCDKCGKFYGSAYSLDDFEHMIWQMSMDWWTQDDDDPRKFYCDKCNGEWDRHTAEPEEEAE